MTEQNDYLVDILHFNRKQNKRIPIKNCKLISNFLFNKVDFYLVYKAGYFFVCTNLKSDLAVLWIKNEIENGEKIASGEVLSQFRKNYVKHNITKEKIGLFLDNPIEYEKQYPKKSK